MTDERSGIDPGDPQCFTRPLRIVVGDFDRVGHGVVARLIVKWGVQ
jgi:hypothetical protein